ACSVFELDDVGLERVSGRQLRGEPGLVRSVLLQRRRLSDELTFDAVVVPRSGVLGRRRPSVQPGSSAVESGGRAAGFSAHQEERYKLADPDAQPPARTA